jgi:hypothetical protein
MRSIPDQVEDRFIRDPEKLLSRSWIASSCRASLAVLAMTGTTVTGPRDRDVRIQF